MFRIADDEELTIDELSKFINKHRSFSRKKLEPLLNAYETKYKIFDEDPKPEWKPDNRIAVNFAKYIVDTFNGFFIGNPIKVTSKNKVVDDYINMLDKYNDQDDNNAELSKMCDIFGFAYEMYFVDENGEIGITYVSPMESFIIYDDSVLERPKYFVRMYIDSDKVMHGSVSDDTYVRYFADDGGLHFLDDDNKPHGFSGVPATEYRENEERIGLFSPVMTMIDAYNKAISEKANDVDYFADAYLKILGAALNDDEIKKLRENRIINFDGDDSDKLVVEFLQKPNGDTTQENLINRLEKLIFQISMVANISDEDFGTSSGISLKYKLQAMSNLAKTKERKFTSGMNRRYMLIFSNPVNKMKKDDWLDIEYKFTFNYPANLLEEAQIAAQLSGIVSKETQLKIISAVEDVQEELNKIEKETDPLEYSTDYPTNRTIEEDTDTDEQVLEEEN